MAEEDKGKPFEKGGDNDLSEGPVKKRCCTDAFCIPIFLAHAVLFWIITFAGFGDGDPAKLVQPRDYRGDYCGVKDQWNNGLDLTNFEKQIWAMNVTSTFDIVAKELVCSSGVGQTVLVSTNAMSEADFKASCGIGELPTMEDMAEMGQEMVEDIQKYTDPAEAVKLFTGGDSSVGGSIMKEATKYFTMSCVKSCDLKQPTSSANQWTYEPDPLAVWGNDPSKRALPMWTLFVNQINGAAGFASLQSQLDMLKFNVWGPDDCPYTDKRYCVPMPGVEFTEIGSFGQCMPRISGPVADLIGGTVSDALDGLAQLEITEDLGEHTKSLGNSIGDTFEAWDVLILVGVASFAIALVTLVLMRFLLAPCVYISLILVFVILAGGGLAIMVRASQCANSTFADAAKDQSSQSTDGTNPFEKECPGGYSIESGTWRDILKVCGYIVLGIAAIWLLTVVCMSCRIKLAVNINKVAAQFLYHNPHILLVPIIQSIFALIWIIFWVFCAAFLMSQVPDDHTPKGGYATYKEAADACQGQWPSGDIWKATQGEECTDELKCWRCMPPRYVLDWRFFYSFFAFLWHNYFQLAVLQCIVAGTVGVWFFSGGKGGKTAVCVAAKNALLWHSGSLMFGSFIIAVIVWVKWFMRYLAKQAEAQHNKVMAAVFTCLAYCIWCFEKCVKFLNKNAYIQIALLGTNFCSSAKAAFMLILRNFLRFGVMMALSYMVHFIMYVLIIAASTVAGYFILQAMYDDIDPVVPTIFYCAIGILMSRLFIGTFALAVDTSLQCFIIAEEMKTPDLVPPALKGFVDDNKDPGGCGSCCFNACCFG